MLRYILPLLLLPTFLFAQEVHNIPESATLSSSFNLTKKDSLLTLNAKDASLKAIFNEIGKQMDIDVIANIPAEEKITLEFKHLPLEEALKRLSRNFVYVTDSEKGKISQIIVSPEVAGAKPTVPTEQREESKAQEATKEKRSKSEPFQFEFDPSQVMDEDKR